MKNARVYAMAALAALATAFALPAMAQDGYYHHESCYDRDQDASAGGALTGAVVGGAAAGPVGAVVGAAVGGSAGDDSVHCRYEHDDGYYDTGYRDGGYYRDDGNYDNHGGLYGSNYREGYGDGYADAAQRYNGSDRGYRYDDSYYARRPSYQGGYYDGYGFWHPAQDDGNYRN